MASVTCLFFEREMRRMCSLYRRKKCQRRWCHDSDKYFAKNIILTSNSLVYPKFGYFCIIIFIGNNCKEMAEDDQVNADNFYKTKTFTGEERISFVFVFPVVTVMSFVYKFHFINRCK